MKFLLPVLVLFLLACENKAVWKDKTNNSEVNVELLFEYDGCKVYRFYDGYKRYFTNCKGSTLWTESCGKNCTRHVEASGGR